MNRAQEKTHFWHDTTLNNLELLHATYVTHSFAPHTHEGYAIGVVTTGAERFAYRRANYVALAGDVVIINPAEVHTGQAHTKQGWTYRMLYPDAEQLRRVATQMIGDEDAYPFFPAAVIHDPDIAQQIIALHKQLEMGTDSLSAEVLWHTMLTALISRHADEQRPLTSPMPRAENRLVQQALSYLHDNYAAAIRLQDLADIVALSPFHFLRLFKAELGLPPHTYLTQLRIHRAKALLNGGQPIAAVAQQVGFTDQSHLSRHFKRIVGVPPGEYQADIR
ncbi:MAG TPA: AraC family transcriptional regulator [Caldilineaceae bacterium]|nr:AraC family transcriptional regulator [Caldilineaceae bacterium]